MKYFLYILALYFFSSATLFAETDVGICQHQELQAKKEMIRFTDNGIVLLVQNGSIPISSVSFDATTNTYFVKPLGFYTPSGVCGNGHPWYPALAGCKVAGCPFFYGRWGD
jgi:hypothetical protein